ncbi:MAG TPA: S4 domain-containing protein [bacterium]|nr:S4 domain-containing protein [bacterium]
MRLQKYLSESGVCSRRKAEEYIAAGLVRVNGDVATIGQSVDPENDVVTVDDKVVAERDSLVYYKLNKPRGIVTTCSQP